MAFLRRAFVQATCFNVLTRRLLSACSSPTLAELQKSPNIFRPFSSQITRLCSPVFSIKTRFSNFAVRQPPPPLFPRVLFSAKSGESPVFEVSVQNIRSIFESKDPIVLYCTAQWCGPCKRLGPKLENDIRSLKGVRLGKLDIDKEPDLAAQMRIQSVPAVFAFCDGKLIDSFIGIPEESNYQSFLEKLRPSEGGDDSEALLEAAEMSLRNGEIEEAIKQFSVVFELHSQKDDDLMGARSLAGLVLCVLKQGEKEAARQMSSNLKSRYKACLGDPLVKSALGAMELGDVNHSTERLAELETLVTETPLRLPEAFELSQIYVSLGRYEEGINILLKIIKKDRHWNEDAAKEYLLKVFESLGPTHDLTVSGRRRLASIWF